MVGFLKNEDMFRKGSRSYKSSGEQVIHPLKSIKVYNKKVPVQDFRVWKKYNCLKVGHNEKQGGSAGWLLLVMSKGHWRSRFVF
jgi:hypothetical protein